MQHAHQKGIIHRDLKPSNVLIALYDGKPVPKVIDFGVAKATGPRLTDQTLYTEFGAVVGTLEYMSPEQAELNQLDIDTRSDIYSLGVLLYELLTGSTPLERKRLKEAAFLEMLRVIREEESPRPSMRLEHDRGAAVDRGVPAHRAAEAERPGAGRARLDRDEGAGEGPQPALRDGQRPGGRPAAVPGRRAGAGVPAVGGLPAEEIRTAEQASPCGVGAARRGSAGRDWWDRRGDRLGATRSRLPQGRGHSTGGADPRRSGAAGAGAKVARSTGRGTAGRMRCWPAARATERPGPVPVRLWLISRWSPVSRRSGCRAASYRSSPAGDWQRERPLGATRKLSAITVSMWGRCRLRRRPPGCVCRGSVAAPLAAALDDWWEQTGDAQSELRGRLLTVASAIDSDPWRSRLRAAVAAKDNAALGRLAMAEDTERQPPQSLVLLAWALKKPEQGIPLLQHACERYPGDFWIRFVLSNLLTRSDPEAALRHADVSRALRPRSPVAWSNLGVRLGSLGKLDQASATYRRAIEVDPMYSMAYYNLGTVLDEQGRPDEAIAEYRKAIALDPKLATAHINLGNDSAPPAEAGRGDRRRPQGHRARPEDRRVPH